ncbi:3-hydroxyacyl-CoA dehydrogenase family protein [Virgibacillus proomii]|uniref:3-hydroxyacyl-CoA dehydrogenase family protein n=1 Tax=Virgibacillus proomii TaxID=84407 RepID=UPI001C0FB1A0|nr:3-hydroxyacyl-CoA dehydrogenase NAD-binding domain-containing protein [Virgibacillus proomii]MBU5265924.1 NAD-binding protein [Virgibacillus proomii]
MKTIGVVGAGTIGQGVAQEFSYYGYKVILVDNSNEALKNAEKGMIQNHKLYQLMGKKKGISTPEDMLRNIQFSANLQDLERVDFLVENIIENYDAKKQLYFELNEICNSDVIYAANTSCIPITKISSNIKKPSNVIGLHFMNPVPLSNLVEVIKGFHTSEETISIATELMHVLKKETVVVNDYPGFVSNRVLMLTINECVFLLQDGVATPEDVDKIFKLGFSHKMGPLATADLIGLDTVLYSLEELFNNYLDPKFRPSPYLKKLVDAGMLGRKTGQGFFKY